MSGYTRLFQLKIFRRDFVSNFMFGLQNFKQKNPMEGPMKIPVQFRRDPFMINYAQQYTTHLKTKSVKISDPNEVTLS